MTEDDVRGLLRELRNEPIPSDSLARVRLSVAERRARKSRRPWLLAFATAAALAIVAVMLRPTRQESLRLPIARIQPIAVAALAPARVQPVAARKHGTARSKVARKSDPLVIRIETEDPDVVILLVGD